MFPRVYGGHFPQKEHMINNVLNLVFCSDKVHQTSLDWNLRPYDYAANTLPLSLNLIEVFGLEPCLGIEQIL